MDTDAQLSERDRSPAPEKGLEQGSRSVRSGWLTGWLTGGGQWRRAGLLVGGCLAVLLLFTGYVMQPFLIPSGSMENTLKVGDRVLVNKLAYRFGGEPRRGDVVVFDGTDSFVQAGPAENPVTGLLRRGAAAVGLAEPVQTDYIKRIIGVGGDRVRCCGKQGRIEVNGVPVSEPYLYADDAPSEVPFDIVVPEGTLWVMGDHRSNSRDSRDHLGEPGGGMVPVDQVIGRADWIGWPFDRMASLDRPGAFQDVPAAGSGRRGGAHHG